MGTTDELTVRRYLPSDAEAVWHLHNRALIAVGAHSGNGPWDTDVRNVEAEYLNTAGEFLAALLDGRIVAMGGIPRTDRTSGEFKRMRVEPAYQRRGYGRRILRALEERARDLGISRLWLETTLTQAAAVEFYTSASYVETARRTHEAFEVLTIEKHI